MATIQNIRQRAQALAEKWQKNSITPEEVGLLIDDLAVLTNDAVINGNALGIRKTYASISAMEADGTAPKDAKGNALRPGQLVAIASNDADNGKIYAFSNPGWMYVTTVDAQYVTQEQLAGVEEKLAELYNTIFRTSDLENLQVEYNYGYVNYDDGTITTTTPSSVYMYSYFVDVKEGEEYVAYTKIGNETIAEISGYINGSYVKDAIDYNKEIGEEKELRIKIPSGINQIRICSTKDILFGIFKIKSQNNRLSDLSNQISNNKSQIDKNTIDIQELKTTSSNAIDSIFSINQELGRDQIFFNWNKGLLQTDGTTTPSSSYYYSDFIKVNIGDIYEIGCSIGSSAAKGLAGYSNNEENTFVDSAFSDIVITAGKIQRVKIVIPEGINYIRIGRSGAYTGDYTAYLVNDKTLKEDVNSIKTSLSLLDNEAIKVDDLTIEIGNNLANPANVQTGKMIDTEGNQYNIEGWALITIPVKEGNTINAGYFDLGRSGYGSFWDNNGKKIEGSNFRYESNLSGKVFTKIVPANAVELRFDIQSPIIETPSYESLMVNYGEDILPYEPYSETITKINNIPLRGSGNNENNNENAISENIIIDLPVSDGSDIQVGFAYIDSTTGNVKVKL